MILDSYFFLFKEWINDAGERWFGTVLKSDKKLDGIGRFIAKEGYIFESQYLDGKRHGYARIILNSGKHVVGLFKKGVKVGTWTTYNSNNVEESSEKIGGLE